MRLKLVIYLVWSLFFLRIGACEDQFGIVFLTEARGLNYRSTLHLLKSIAKHPRDGSKNGDVGHAWIYLYAYRDGNYYALEGGHSGERGIVQPKYLDGVMNLIEYGTLFPSLGQSYAQSDPNPIRYLWCTQRDGFFQKGSGGHRPTFAAHVQLNKQQYQRIYQFIGSYSFTNYSLCQNQCTTFVAQIAQLIGIELEIYTHLHIEQHVCLQGEKLCLWTDPYYSQLWIATPDRLEISLKQLVKEAKAINALSWYYHTHPRHLCFGKIKHWIKTLPERLARLQFYYLL